MVENDATGVVGRRGSRDKKHGEERSKVGEIGDKGAAVKHSLIWREFVLEREKSLFKIVQPKFTLQLAPEMHHDNHHHKNVAKYVTRGFS